MDGKGSRIAAPDVRSRRLRVRAIVSIAGQIVTIDTTVHLACAGLSVNSQSTGSVSGPYTIDVAGHKGIEPAWARLREWVRSYDAKEAIATTLAKVAPGLAIFLLLRCKSIAHSRDTSGSEAPYCLCCTRSWSHGHSQCQADKVDVGKVRIQATSVVGELHEAPVNTRGWIFGIGERGLYLRWSVRGRIPDGVEVEIAFGEPDSA